MSLLSLYQSGYKRETDRAIKARSDIAALSSTMARKQRELSRTSSPSRAKTLSSDLQRLAKRQADLQTSAALYEKRAVAYAVKVKREEAKQAVRADSELRATLSDMEARLSEVETALIEKVRGEINADPVPREYDVFLSHPDPDWERTQMLFQELTARDLSVWFDRDVMKLGDSLTVQIDRGLAKSKVGVIHITPAYLEDRFWGGKEFGGLMSSRKRIIPVLDRVTREELAAFSPLLTDLLGLSTEEMDFGAIADLIVAAVTG